MLIFPQKFNLLGIYIEDFQTETAQHEVFGVPTTILYFEGKEIMRKSGYYSLEGFFSKAEKILKLAESQE